MGGCTDCEVKNAIIAHLQGCCGVKAYYTKNVSFENVETYDADDGKGANGDADGFVANYADNLTFINCSSHNNSEDGFDLGSNVTIINSKAYDNTGGGIKVWRRPDDGYAKKTAKIINSLVYHNGYEAIETRESGNPGIKASRGAELQLYNSVIYGNHDEGVAIRGFNTAPDTAYSIISNTIITNNGYKTAYNDGYAGIGVDQSTPGYNHVTASNNLYFNNTSANSGLLWDINSINGQNPLFSSAATGDFHLPNISPAIDKGIDLSALFAYDFKRVPRPQGAGFDIGAYEWIEPDKPYFTSPATVRVDIGGAFVYKVSYVIPNGTPPDEIGYPMLPSWAALAPIDSVTGTAPNNVCVDTIVVTLLEGTYSDTLRVKVYVDDPSAVVYSARITPAKFDLTAGMMLNGAICFVVKINKPGKYDLGVYNLAGRRLWTYATEDVDAGVYSINWNAVSTGRSRISNGMYFAILRQKDKQIGRPFLIVR